MEICTNGLFIFKKRLWIFSSLCFFITTIRSAEMKKDFATVLTAGKKFKIFDTKKKVETGTDWNEFVPQDLLILPGVTPSGFFYTRPREVHYIDFSTLFEAEPYRHHVHACTQYTPMVAAAQKGNSLIVVSVCNCEKDGKRVAEYIVSNTVLGQSNNISHGSIFGNKTTYQRKYFPFSAQAIELSRNGKILAIATSSTVHIFNLETEKSDFRKFISSQGPSVLLIDIAMKQSLQIVAVESEGRIEIKNIDENEPDMSNLKTVATEEGNIDRIHFFDSSDLVLVADGVAKIIEPKNWLENSKGVVPTRTFAYEKMLNKADVDQNSELATVHWSDNSQISEKGHSAIKVHREHGTMTEQFILKIALSQDQEGQESKYSYITPHGNEARVRNHWLCVALRGNHAIALSTNGNIYLWTLPDKPKTPSELDARELRTGRFDQFASARRSLSSPTLPGEILQKIEKRKMDKNPDKSADKMKRRSLMQHLRTSTLGGDKDKGDKSSKEHSREQSREQSPTPTRTSSKRDRKDKKEKEDSDSPQKQHSGEHPFSVATSLGESFAKLESSLPLIVSAGDLEDSQKMRLREEPEQEKYQEKHEPRERDRSSLQKK